MNTWASAWLQRRRPADLVKVLVGGAVVLVTAQFVRPDRVGGAEEAVFRFFNDFPLPAFLYPLVWAVMQFGNFGSVPATAAVAAVTRRWRMALDFAVAGGVIYWVAKLIKVWQPRGRPQTLLDAVHILGEPARGLGYVSGHSAVAIALATVASSYLGKWGRRVVWTAAIGCCCFRMYVGAHLPLDVLGGAGLGLAAGGATHLLFGSPTRAKERRAQERTDPEPVLSA